MAIERKQTKKLAGHGSLTKSGKVRQNTPDRGVKTGVHKQPSGPRNTRRRKYELTLLQEYADKNRKELKYRHVGTAVELENRGR